MNKNVFTFTFLLGVCCLLATSLAAAPNATVHLTPAQTTPAAIGEQVVFNVDIASQQPIDAYQFTLTFDPTALRYVSSTNGDYLPDVFVAPAQVKTSQVTLAAVSLSGGNTGEGSLAALTFEVLSQQASPLTLSEVLLPVTTGGLAEPQVINGPTGASLSEPRHPVHETAVLPNYPNPFNPETWIPYHLAAPAEVTLHIYSMQGELVRALTLGYQEAGAYQHRSRAAYWDGTNALGEPVASGVYFYTFTAGDFSATGKMVIMK